MVCVFDRGGFSTTIRKAVSCGLHHCSHCTSINFLRRHEGLLQESTINSSTCGIMHHLMMGMKWYEVFPNISEEVFQLDQPSSCTWMPSANASLQAPNHLKKVCAEAAGDIVPPHWCIHSYCTTHSLERISAQNPEMLNRNQSGLALAMPLQKGKTLEPPWRFPKAREALRVQFEGTQLGCARQHPALTCNSRTHALPALA